MFFKSCSVAHFTTRDSLCDSQSHATKTFKHIRLKMSSPLFCVHLNTYSCDKIDLFGCFN